MDCFGYKSQYDSAEEGNLFFEQKNTSNSKKADGAIKKDGEVIAVIELKSTKTKNLDDVKNQAFGYYTNNSKCEYVITSNFNKLRFYIERNEDYLEFDLFNIDKEEFKLLWLCLDSKNLLKGKPKEIKNKSIVSEEKITKKLYQDYSSFRLELFNDLVKNNPNIEKKTILNKTQKLLDRILFILFAEDRALLPINTISEIISNWKTDNARGRVEPLYSNFIEYFNLINTGRPKRGDYDEIYSYNGGLFIKDDTLNSLEISNNILLEFGKKLTAYDFESEVSVDILGHIFEQSLSEIEELQNQIDGVENDNSKSKRKKDGVYYTPKYITKYIVDNTLGKLCEEKKIKLEINEETYSPSDSRRRNRINALEEYRNWLLKLTICDPACGSGAFLIQALNFLIKEHHYIDELSASYNKDSLVLSDVKNSILENNLYGVDINQESVEIAKLSLWLNTAESNRKLTSLNNNIKCGNSLIDDPEVLGDKAFDWQNEFPDVFEKGGFDVVIGNPPYVRKQGLMEHYPELCDFYEKTFTAATGNYDIYTLFMEHSLSLINTEGIVSYILPHKFLVSDFGVGIRGFLKENKAVERIVHFGSEMVFSDASTYTCIINLNKSEKNNIHFKKVKPLEINNPFEWDMMDYKNLNRSNWDLQGKSTYNLIEKLKGQPYTVENVFRNIFVGLQTGLDGVFVFEGVDKGNHIRGYNSKFNYHFDIEKDLLKPILGGKDVFKYLINQNSNYVLFPYKKDGNPISIEFISKNYPKTFSYLKRFESEIKGREKGKMNLINEWHLFTRENNHKKFPFPKIMTREISLGCNMTYDENGEFYHNTKVYSFVKDKSFNVDDKFYLGILNSKIMWFFIKNTGSEYRGGYYVFKTNYLKPFPLPAISNNPEVLIEKVENILAFNKNLRSVSAKFKRTLSREFSEQLETLSNKLELWYDLTFEEFILELKKKKIVFKIGEDSDLENYFTKEQQKALEMKSKINQTDKEIDEMVYELYGLTKEEIEIVENS